MKHALFFPLLSLASLGCGQEPVDGTFTSRVVQHEACRVVGDRPETCTREEVLLDLRVRLVERDDKNVWLYGIPRGGVSDRAILGSRDTEGGFVFVDEVSQENQASRCVLTDRLELTLAIDPEADLQRVGTDPCIALVGRETATTTQTAGCDRVNNPPLEQTFAARRRWERPPTCAP
jgi:hypothetical protein